MRTVIAEVDDELRRRAGGHEAHVDRCHWPTADFGTVRLVHAQLVTLDVEHDLGGPGRTGALVMADATREAAEPRQHRHQPRVVCLPGSDHHGRSLPGVGPDPMPRSVVPMKATAGDLPVGDGWTYEVKWDGMRALAFVQDGRLRVQSANERDVTVSWPELAGLPDALPTSAVVLDGELVATDAQGRPSFGRLQQRMHISSAAEAARRANEVPVSYVVFDVLHLDGHDVTGLPLSDRRRLLAQVVEPAPRWRTSPVHDDGIALLEAADSQGLEGVVAKRADSRYEPGARVRTWLKVKVRRHQEVVVGGWLPGEGNRSGRIGALLVGVHDRPGDGGPLRYAGRVGTGFTEAELGRLAERAAALVTDDCPFDPPPPRPDVARGATWLRPELVAEIAYGEWTDDHRLRHPSYLGLRFDKDADQVTRDP